MINFSWPTVLNLLFGVLLLGGTIFLAVWLALRAAAPLFREQMRNAILTAWIDIAFQKRKLKENEKANDSAGN